MPGEVIKDSPSSTLGGDAGLLQSAGKIDINHPGVFQHIAFPTVAQNDVGSIAACYHEWTNDSNPLQFVLCTRCII